MTPCFTLVHVYKIIGSHTLNAICLPHDNATALYSHFYQHHNDNRIGVNNRKKLPKCWYRSVNFRQELTKGWEGGKTVALSGKKRITESRERAETGILTCTQVPHSVWENFVSRLFHELSWQENISHTLSSICLPHDNATALYWQEEKV